MNVADVIADVISDRGRITYVVLRDPGFDLTDQVGTDVSSLGVNTAADS